MITLVLQKIEGRLAFIPPQATNERQALHNLLDLCEKKHNGYVSLSFAVPYKKRTSGRKSQNHKLNGNIMAFCNETGNDFDDVKDEIKRRAIKRGYPCKKDEQGNYILSLKDGQPIPESETKINTVECGYLIDEMSILASEYNVLLPY